MREAKHRRETAQSQQRHQREIELSQQRHQREIELSQQRHRQELEQKEHDTIMELRVKAQLDTEMENRTRLEITRDDHQRDHELKMEEVKVKGREAEARIAEAKAKEAASVARAKSIEEAIMKAKTKEKEIELQSMLWKKYFDQETNVDDKILVMEQIKKLTLGNSQNTKKPAKEVKTKSKMNQAEIHPRQQRPWTQPVPLMR